MDFVAYGNPGIEGTHKTAFEITQHTSVVPKGDLVIGTRANFDPEALAALAQVSNKIRITLRTRGITETITGDSNKDYVPGPSIIVRKAGASPQTIITNADKSAGDLPRKLIRALQNPEEHLIVIIERA